MPRTRSQRGQVRERRDGPFKRLGGGIRQARAGEADEDEADEGDEDEHAEGHPLAQALDRHGGRIAARSLSPSAVRLPN